MSLLRLAYVIALRRIIANWRLELVLLLGVVLAVALLSSGVVFSDLLSEAALRRALEQATPEEVNFSVRTYSGQNTPRTAPEQASAYRASLDFVEGRVASRFQPHLRARARLLETATFFFEGHPQLELASNIRPRGQIKYMSGLLPDRIEVVQGRWPYGSSLGGVPSRGGPLEVAIDTMGAELLRLGVGDEMAVFPATEVTEQPPMRVEIVGVFRKMDPRDEFWYGANRTFSLQYEQWPLVPLFTTEDAVLDQVIRVYPGLYIDTTWFFYLDRHSVRAREVGILQDTIQGVQQDVHTNLANSATAIKLDQVLENYEEQLLLARVPLFLMLFLVTGILIYYLALVAGLVVRSRATEIAMLKSRGTTTLQVGLLTLVEGLLLAVPAVGLGPFLALGVARALGRFFFDGSGKGQPVPVAFSSQAFLLGVGGAILAVAVLTISTLVAAR